jgi:acetyl-CoA carboxylase beta subunit
LEEIVKCPVCDKRVFDLEWKDRTTVKIKCRHCNKIVAVTREAPVSVARAAPDIKV